MTSIAAIQSNDSNDSYFKECLEHLKDICKSKRIQSFDQDVAAKKGACATSEVSGSVEAMLCV